jgi:hypothetical protein
MGITRSGLRLTVFKQVMLRKGPDSTGKRYRNRPLAIEVSLSGRENIPRACELFHGGKLGGTRVFKFAKITLFTPKGISIPLAQNSEFIGKTPKEIDAALEQFDQRKRHSILFSLQFRANPKDSRPLEPITLLSRP